MPHVRTVLVMRSDVLWRPGGLEAVLRRWNKRGEVRSCLAADHVAPARSARTAALGPEAAAFARRVLAARGIEEPYSHQTLAYSLANAGKDVVVATPTASGKSMAYVLPLVERLGADPQARALLLFPTKALARDQEESIRRSLADAGVAAGTITYDGDTPGAVRRTSREQARVILTNPDMLHSGILPHHAAWARLFAGLCLVVIDELHVYRGVFGSHLANVLRRLDRVTAFHGSRPTYVLTSATIANPAEHASRLLGRPVEPVTESGAAHGPRRFFLYDPPVVNAELGLRASCLKSAVRLVVDLVREDVATILFVSSRREVELGLRYLRSRLAKHVSKDVVAGYRGGYLPSERREIEKGLREGRIRAVVSTSALELGIDVGELDACVCAGYPGTISGLWQRSGRAGRRLGPSVTVLVASSAPVDRWLARNPEFLLGAPVEEARIDPDNLEILVPHLKCAAFELAFAPGDRYGSMTAADTAEALGYLEGHGVVHASGGRFHWIADAYPATHVSLRSVGWDNVVVIEKNEETDEQTLLGEIDFHGAHTMLHEQAIYQHDARTFEVVRLDLPNKKAFVRAVAPDYYTTAMTATKVLALRVSEEGSAGGGRAAWGDVRVTDKVTGYKKLKFETHENVGYGDVHLPDREMLTTALWIEIDAAEAEAMKVARATLADGLRGLSQALHTVACLERMCDPRDLGTALEDGGAETGPERLRLYVYDAYPGGIGLSAPLFASRGRTLDRAAGLVRSCTCEAGCPGCVGPVDVPSVPSRKEIALQLLGRLRAS